MDDGNRRNGGRPEVVVVTGASAGVGRATVQAFARRGAQIGLVARGADGREALVLTADVANPEQVEAVATAAWPD